MPSDGVPFTCPECGHEATFRNRYTGTIRVAWHFFWSHPDLSFDAGNPLSEETGPDVDDFQEVMDDGE